MTEIRVKNAPTLPLLIYDGDCDFCRFWIEQWRHVTGEHVLYASSQKVSRQFTEIPEEHFKTAVLLIDLNGKVFSGAEAVFRTLAHNPHQTWALWLYQQIPGLAPIIDHAYLFIARHRWFFSALTRWFWGQNRQRPTFFVTRWLFLKLLGGIYLIAFLSLWTQIDGLVGSNGILPAEGYLSTLREQIGFDRYWRFPTLCWLSASDSFLNLLCAAGVLCSLFLIIGIAPILSLIVLWMSYLSLTTIGQTFLAFQWDSLLLETGFLAVFFAPLQILPKLSHSLPPSTCVLWLLRWLLFRLMFASGIVKLLSGDTTWLNFTALNFHYETQPLPTAIGWYAHQLPDWFQKLSVAAMLGIEIIVPFFIFSPQRLRFFGAVAIVILQVIIAATGNYCFFNLLTIVLCVLLVDDTILRRFLPGRLGTRFASSGANTGKSHSRTILISMLAAFILLVSGVRMAGTSLWREGFPPIVQHMLTWTAPFHIVNSYGLFAVMTTSRAEIEIEGSNDGNKWRNYSFKSKPGDLKHRPRWTAPHQPRLDWQMWFAALNENYHHQVWFINFMLRLLQGSPAVLQLLAENPFPDMPPRFIRGVLYNYQFTNLETNRKKETWWKRERQGLYCPPIAIRTD